MPHKAERVAMEEVRRGLVLYEIVLRPAASSLTEPSSLRPAVTSGQDADSSSSVSALAPGRRRARRHHPHPAARRWAPFCRSCCCRSACSSSWCSVWAAHSSACCSLRSSCSSSPSSLIGAVGHRGAARSLAPLIPVVLLACSSAGASTESRDPRPVYGARCAGAAPSSLAPSVILRGMQARLLLAFILGVCAAGAGWRSSSRHPPPIAS